MSTRSIVRRMIEMDRIKIKGPKDMNQGALNGLKVLEYSEFISGPYFVKGDVRAEREKIFYINHNQIIII